MQCLYSSLLVTFVWWAKGFSNVSMEVIYFHWVTLMFSHFNSSNTVVKCSFLQPYDIWLELTNPIGLGSFLPAFSASCIRRSVALPDLFTFFTIANTLFLIGYMLVQFQEPSHLLQCMYKATWMLPIDKCFFLIFLTSHNIKVFYFRLISSGSGNNSSLSSGVMLSVFRFINIRCSNVIFIVLCPLKAATTLLPFCNKLTLKKCLGTVFSGC